MTQHLRALLAVAALSAGSALALPSQAATPQPLGTYVVTVAAASSPLPVLDRARSLGGEVGFVYSHALNGFSVKLPHALAPALRLLPGVSAVQRDQPLHATALQSQRRPPSYGLDRIDQRRLPLSTSFATSTNGAGVTAYIIDTGILYTHRDFRGRAVKGIDTVTRGGNGVDCNGHGTHVAGTVGGSAFGVAKQVRLVGVRVLDCEGQGSTSTVLAGLDWVIAHHRAGAPAVANMSLGGSPDAALDAAVNRAIADGITVGVAAGNDSGPLADLLGGSNACRYSPARVPKALTVAASDSSDRRASYSNFGSCVDLFAPGTAIVSAWSTSATASRAISGTSMATPHVVGAAALYLSGVGYRTPAQVTARILGRATTGVVSDAGSQTPNRLLFTG